MKTQNHFILAILLSVLFFGGCGEERTVEKPVVALVKAIQVASGANFVEKSFPGKASAAQEANLSFRVSGPLIRFPVKIGDEVRKGDLLARIDSRDFEVRLNNAKGQLTRATAALTLAEMEYARVQRTWQQDRGAVSESMIDQHRENYHQIKAGMQSLEASVTAAKDALSDTLLRAPFTGIVVKTFAENYEDVQAKIPVVRLIDIADIEFTVDIPEDDISRIPQVEKALIQFDIYPDRNFSARIKEIGKEASETTRTYPVTLVMAQSDDIKIYPGMAGRARFASGANSKELHPAIEIPLSAIFKGSGESDFVWVINPESRTIKRRQMKLGTLTRNGVTVLEGLASGEWIVTAGVNTLNEGQSVQILRSAKVSRN
ncbi:Efflux transporter, RND family, MFP subunit [Desulfosarcina cetonica]|uniref:efflux RND transporter periplasmic adaptor subunit n=1 Tax=Desulfosarcina cetonica TaxID=90730 RepID=UPI0006D09A1D|nr:efflux RND transporter periplasmic adaptor subunit [Desulfosarcina cetonica]VTR70344.1 Efflux transporter, RND family, MFP subunit [Desulfosarcina cetonica]